MTFDKSKDFAKRTQSDQILRDKACRIASNSKYDGYQVYYLFKDNIQGVDLADMELIRKYSKGIRYLLCTIDIFSKYAWVVPLKDKKGITIINAFQSILDS